MKNMRNILGAALVAAVIGLMALPAAGGVGTVNPGITNSIINNATTTVNVGTAVKVNDYDNVGVEFMFQGDRAGTGGLTVTFARSVDNVSWETTPRFAWAPALNGNTAVVAYTNFPSSIIGGAGWIKVVSIANADVSATATNARLRVILKKIPK